MWIDVSLKWNCERLRIDEKQIDYMPFIKIIVRPSNSITKTKLL